MPVKTSGKVHTEIVLRLPSVSQNFLAAIFPSHEKVSPRSQLPRSHQISHVVV